MTQFRDVLRALEIGFTYHLKTSFVLGDDTYIAVGKVEGAERDYVCLSVGYLDTPEQICLVTFSSGGEAYDVHPVTCEDSFQVVDGQSIDCMMLSALVLGAFYCLGEKVTGARQLIAESAAIARVVIQTAEAAGIFGGHVAYEDVMRFGKNSNRAYSNNPQIKRLRALRNACRPDSPDTIREYASILVAGKALEMFAGL